MSVEKVLIVPDTHAPFHDERAWQVMLKAARGFKPQTLVHIGDLADFYSVSSHSKDPARKLALKDELLVVREKRAELDALKGVKRKEFVEGNHEFRLVRYLQDKAPELFGLINTDELLELSENGWNVTPYKQSVQVGKVNFTHDVGLGGKYSTARALETFQHSVVIGHHHAIQYFVGGNAEGENQVGAQFGWLGDFDEIDYMHKIKVRRSWAHGFGIGYHDTRTGAISLVPIPIINYKATVEGKEYTA